MLHFDGLLNTHGCNTKAEHSKHDMFGQLHEEKAAEDREPYEYSHGGLFASVWLDW